MPIKKSKGKKKEVETKKSTKVDKKADKKSKGSSLRDRAKDKIKESKKKGFTAMRESKNERNNNYSKFRNFFVSKGDTKPVIFLTDDPVVVRTHSVQKQLPNKKMFYPEFLCTEDDDCGLCQEAKDGNKSVSKPANMGAILVLDVEGYENKDNQEVPYIVRPMLVNPSLASVLEHRDLKEGLLFTAFEMSKLDRGHSLDVIRDEDDEIQRFEDEEDILDMIREENEDTAKMLQEALDQHGDFRTWLEEEIIPDFLNPELAEFEQSSSSKEEEEEEEGSKYSFRKGRKGKDKGSDKKDSKKKGNRLRNRLK